MYLFGGRNLKMGEYLGHALVTGIQTVRVTVPDAIGTESCGDQHCVAGLEVTM